MQTKIVNVEGHSVEMPVLTEEGLKKQEELEKLIVAEYEASGSLSNPKLLEAAEQYQTEILNHLAK